MWLKGSVSYYNYLLERKGEHNLKKPFILCACLSLANTPLANTGHEKIALTWNKDVPLTSSYETLNG